MTPIDLIRAAFQPPLSAVAPHPAKVPDYLGLLKPPATPDHADYQANLGMPLGKALEEAARSGEGHSQPPTSW